MNHTAFVGVGSNIDAPRNCIAGIRQIIGDERVPFFEVSSLYRTSPVSPVAQDDFLNCVVKIGWKGDASELLAFLEKTERAMGRERVVHLGPRTLDLDILLFDELVLHSEHLTIPHPRLHERKFVLVPLVEIDRDLIHPVMHLPLSHILNGLGDEQKIGFFERITDEAIAGSKKNRNRAGGSAAGSRRETA